MIIISPSLLAADFSNIKEDIYEVENAGAQRLHLDVMDGHFVPNLSFGPFIIQSIRKKTKCHLETHLMINNPNESIDQYIDAGSDTIIFHFEASDSPAKLLMYIRDNNVCAGIAINPDTDENLLIPLLDYLDYILVMSVFPGSGGQAFIPDTLNKMKNINSMRSGRNILLGVDGGINMKTISKAISTNIDIAVIGSGLFNAADVNQRFQDLLHA